MILDERFVQLVSDPLAALWAGNCNSKLEPELVRLSGAQVEGDRMHLLLFAPQKYVEGLVSNFADTDKLTFLLGVILTNESYQLKGSYLSHRTCTASEVDYQKLYVTSFSTALEDQCLPSDRAFQTYFDQHAVTVRMLVREVYEQTPKVGTGERVV